MWIPKGGAVDIFVERENEFQPVAALPIKSPKVVDLGNSQSEHPMLRLQRMMGNHAVQRLLRDKGVDASEGALEQEADRAAEHVMRMPEAGSGVGSAQSGPMAQGEPSATVAGDAVKEPGQPLDEMTRESMESQFGSDFANVRVHADSNAAGSARGLNARAFTTGDHIVFGKGEYSPTSSSGRWLLAHELAHVVQQSRAPSRSQGFAGSLSRVPSPGIQRALMAWGDPGGFVALANSVIAVQKQVVLSPPGLIFLWDTNIQVPPTPEAQELISVLQTVINDSKTTTIEFIHGTTSTRPSDARVMVGSYPQSKIDLDDIGAFGTQGSVGVGQGRTAGALLSHEITEQYRKQVHGEAFPVAHPQGEAAESLAVGGVRGTMTQRQVNSTTIEFSVPYTYPDGRVVDVTWDVVNGNVTNVRRKLRP